MSGTMSSSWIGDPQFEEYIRLWNCRKFFEAHEALEVLWLRVEGGEKEFLQGLIQLAVALEHLARGNVVGGTKVLASARARFAGLPEGAPAISARALADSVEDYLAGRIKEPPAFPDFPRPARGSSV